MLKSAEIDVKISKNFVTYQKLNIEQNQLAKNR